MLSSMIQSQVVAVAAGIALSVLQPMFAVTLMILLVSAVIGMFSSLGSIQKERHSESKNSTIYKRDESMKEDASQQEINEYTPPKKNKSDVKL